MTHISGLSALKIPDTNLFSQSKQRKTIKDLCPTCPLEPVQQVLSDYCLQVEVVILLIRAL